ncbi:MAG: lysylphosphatidylglycerol synthase transmembrane domain-containing protein [Gemmiger sp.]|nr:lysylphosphatidylglycerol synthase transmembrane domain-containing protein [Gemmiger sp.]
MTGLLLLASVALVLLGHLFRLLRWEQFIRIYERPARGSLLRGLAGGYAINFLLPFHVGDIFRAIYCGRRMKSGTGFAFATVIMDRFLDVWVVAFCFGVMRAVGPDTAAVQTAAVRYFVFALVLAITLILVIALRDGLKKICLAICGIFNDTIKLDGMVFCWSLINTFKDLRRVRLLRLFFNTAAMWAAYLSGYGLLAACLTRCGGHFAMADVFTMLFGANSVDVTSFTLTGQLHAISPAAQAAMVCWFLLPLAAMLGVTLLPARLRGGLNRVSNPDGAGDNYLNLLPQVDARDRAAFLTQYFGLQNKEYIGKFLKMNQDITILQDYSAGSNATTMLCMDKTGTFYRKYAFGADGDKLACQLAWLRQQQAALPLCEILRAGNENGCCWYDMAYSTQAVSFFRYIHSNPAEKSTAILLGVLNALDARLYHLDAPAPAAPAAMEGYITQKVDANLARLHEARALKELLTYDRIWVNGVPCKNLGGLARLFDHARLSALFAGDPLGVIHGDLTIENIICQTGRAPGQAEDSWYLIDPNTGNLHESPFLDYGKLLQSLHGGYEFMMMTPRVTVQENRVDFTFTRSAAYDALFAALCQYLEARFTPRQVESIFTHELIHWLRLMPYKLAKDKKRAAMFYAGLLLVANDIDRRYPGAAQ